MLITKEHTWATKYNPVSCMHFELLRTCLTCGIMRWWCVIDVYTFQIQLTGMGVLYSTPVCASLYLGRGCIVYNSFLVSRNATT